MVYYPTMVVRMRSTRSHRNNRRSHHALVAPAVAKCECGAEHRRHQVCNSCGKYRGRQVIDIVARTERTQSRLKRKEKALKESGQATAADKEESKKETKVAKK